MPVSRTLESLEIYQLAMELGDMVWSWTENWNLIAIRTIGEQIVRSADSVAANIAEGHGRFFYKDRRRFCYFSRGSLLETKTWAVKSIRRMLFSEEEYNLFINKFELLHLKLNNFINNIERKISEE